MTVDVVYTATLSVPVTTDSGNTATVALTATEPMRRRCGPWMAAYVIVQIPHVPTVNGVSPTGYPCSAVTTPT